MITVIGSMNMDLVVKSEAPPLRGETILGESFDTHPGGKGANQAIAVAKLGGEVQIAGKVGSDTFGKEMIANLHDHGVDTQYVQKVPDTTSGVALITVAENDNSIIVVPGANYLFEPGEASALRTLIQSSQMLIVQLETPLPFVEMLVSIAFHEGTPVVVNPAPAQTLNISFIQQATYVTPNETECAILFEEPIEEAIARYPNKLIVTQGVKGALYHDGANPVRIEGFPVQAIDTTGAGDTFNGALGLGLAEGRSLTEAVRFANAAASLSVEHFGAQSGMPKRERVERRLRTGE
ncbi:ribokinase [Geomicrobium halophilum]|uniref:Ribokinase n=1 Tax=Geomicrobium halophilum TaxID=549000 RepID=A0A841PMJ0_9BACL|nr:ribokinase [Geomicrobium halophilum]MBB6448446.1 ribokinase [Geomicrobium halophilum]